MVINKDDDVEDDDNLPVSVLIRRRLEADKLASTNKNILSAVVDSPVVSSIQSLTKR